MAVVEAQEVERLALHLTEKERAHLARKLLASLPSSFDEDDDDDWVDEALRRDREMDENPDSAMTHEEFFESLRKYVK